MISYNLSKFHVVKLLFLKNKIKHKRIFCKLASFLEEIATYVSEYSKENKKETKYLVAASKNKMKLKKIAIIIKKNSTLIIIQTG